MTQPLASKSLGIAYRDIVVMADDLLIARNKRGHLYLRANGCWRRLVAVPRYKSSRKRQPQPVE